jgi:hypothetical protein
MGHTIQRINQKFTSWPGGKGYMQALRDSELREHGGLINVDLRLYVDPSCTSMNLLVVGFLVRY